MSSDRESLLALSQSLEEQLAAGSGDQQLRDSVDSLHAGCVSIIDTVPATGRFRFRTLLNRLDEQARELNPGVRADDRIIGDLRGTVKEVTAVLQR